MEFMKHVAFGFLPPWLDMIIRIAVAGICGFGIGSSITDKKPIESGDFKAITRLAENL